MNTHARQFVAFLFIALSLCVWLASVHSQSGTLRRITNTPERALNLNPTLSGDGRQLAFESTENLSGASGNGSGFHTLRVDLSGENPSFTDVAATRAPAPAMSQDGAHIAFASRENLTGQNADGNSEIFFYAAAQLQQLTNTTPGDEAHRISDGNFQPSISDDGQLIAFASNRDLAAANADANLEIFLYNAATRIFTQITNSVGTVGASDAKISGDGTRGAFIRDNRTARSDETTTRDLVLFDRAANSTRLIAGGVNNLALTYGRALSDDGARVVYAAQTATNTTQVFLFDGRNDDALRQITSLGSRVSDVPLHPTISGDGSRLAFATRRSVAGSGTDGGVELHLYDLPSARFTRITNAPASATAEVVSSLNDDGSLVAFNFPRVLSGMVSDNDFNNNPEIYLASLAPRSDFATNLRVQHGASFGKEPARLKAVAPGQVAIANGTNLALAAIRAKPLADNSFPQTLGGATLNVNGRAAPLFYVSPTQINFFVPAETETSEAQFVVRNHDGFESRGSFTVLPAVPGVFTEPGDGSGAAIALDAPTFLRSPFDPIDASNNLRRLTIFATGVRNATNVSVTVGGRALTVEAIIASPDLPGLDEIHVVLSRSLIGAGNVPLVVRADGREGNPTTLNFSGTRRAVSITLAPATSSLGIGRTLRFAATVRDVEGDEITNAPVVFSSTNATVATIDPNGTARGLSAGATMITATSGEVSATAQLTVSPLSLVLNETLADPPEDAAGDANHDGTRSAAQDEFIEIVNASPMDVDIGGYQLTTRGSNGLDTVRHTFAPGAIIAPGTAIVVFGGAQAATFDPNHPAFAGALALTASTGGLSLTNTGSVVKLLSPNGETIEQLSYGGTTGLAGDRNQSLTRAPDVAGDFALHQTATGSGGRFFSPGTRLDDTPFEITSPIARIEVAPAVASISAGVQQQFIARAFDAQDLELQGIIFRWQSSDPAIATIDNNGLANALAVGNVEIKAGARGVQSAPANLRVDAAQPTVSRVEVAPAPASLNRGGTLQFTARAFDQNGRAVNAASFTWTSTNVAIASVNASGVARGNGFGSVTVIAKTSDGAGGMVAGEAMLEVRVPLVFNEILADVPPDNTQTRAVEGDANRDGVRNSDDDEFVELLNNSEASIDLSGLILADATTNRYTFPANTSLAAGRALIVFGGGSPPASDPAFGGALILTTSSLGLNDAGDTITLKINIAATEIVLASQSYGTGGTGAPPAPSDQSLTRSPDAAINSTGGSFIAHPLAANAASRVFSPGTRSNGTPFGSASISRIDIVPSSAMVEIGAMQEFTARAYALLDGVENELPNVSFIWDSSDAGKASVAPATGRTTTTLALSAGSTTIRARAGGLEGAATLIVNPPPPVLSRLVLSPASATIIVGGTQQFNAQAFDQYDQSFPVSAITFNSDNVTVAMVETVNHTPGGSSATAIVSGRSAGTARITATASDGSRSVDSNPATLNVNSPPPRITRIEVSPSSATIGVGATQQFAARAFDQNEQEIQGVTFAWATGNANVAAIDQNGLATGAGAGTTDVTASSGNVTSPPATLNVTAPPVPLTGQVIINEALISFATSSTQTRNDFIELYNSTAQTLDISGLLLSFRPSGSGNTPVSVTLPGAVGSGVTLIPARGYFLIVNGAETFGVAADFDARTNSFDLNNTTGGIKIEISGTKLDGLSYQGSSTPPAAPFNTFGEGTIFTFTSGTTNDLIRSPNAGDTNNNAADFRRNGTASSVSPKAANP